MQAWLQPLQGAAFAQQGLVHWLHTNGNSHAGSHLSLMMAATRQGTSARSRASVDKVSIAGALI